MNKIQKAIGLIEIMLVLVVVAIMAIASIKYYTSTQAAQKVNDAVQIFGEVRSAFNNYLVDNNNSPYTTGTTVVQVSDLYSDGYLPDTYQGCQSQSGTDSGTNSGTDSGSGDDTSSGGGCFPYGGYITLSVSSGLITIKMNGIPGNDCEPIANRLQSTMNTNLGETTAKNCSTSGGSQGVVNLDNYVSATYVM